jgi:FRG domain
MPKQLWHPRWETARLAWLSFLDDIDSAREELGCFYKNAWFRGMTCDSHELIPRLLRHPRAILARLTALDTRIEQLRTQQVDARNRKAIWNARQRDTRWAGEIDRARAEFDSARTQAKELGKQLSKSAEERERILRHFREQCLNRESLRETESDAFIRFSHRASAPSSRSSWEILAEMSHYEGQTRLLDWSESLSVALFFALREYRFQLDQVWNESRAKIKTWIEPSVAGQPCVWVLNPFLLSLYATEGRRSSIWDFSYDDGHDYYRSFVLGDPEWPYTFPIPIYPPWRDLRIAAQRGVFTVQGRDTRPLDAQKPNQELAAELQRLGLVSKRVVAKVPITRDAAIYGVRQLRRYEGLDHFLLFRDTDSLGRSIREDGEEAKHYRTAED